jgi:hypothetical protein
MACAASPRITAEEEKWKGAHFIEIKGRCGLLVNEVIREEGEMSVVTPGKWVLKNSGTEEGVWERVVKFEEGMKSVQVKEPSWVC